MATGATGARWSTLEGGSDRPSQALRVVGANAVDLPGVGLEFDCAEAAHIEHCPARHEANTPADPPGIADHIGPPQPGKCPVAPDDPDTESHPQMGGIHLGSQPAEEEEDGGGSAEDEEGHPGHASRDHDDGGQDISQGNDCEDDPSELRVAIRHARSLTPVGALHMVIRRSNTSADDQDMAEKLTLGLLCALLLAVVGLYRLDSSAGIPFLSSSPVATVPAYVETIATPAAVALPEIDIDTWFADSDGAEEAVDPYDSTTWGQIAAFVEESRTPGGWAETCALATSATGGDRVEAPLPGALACSDIAAVTEVQQFAAMVLNAQAEVALWIRGVPGHSLGGIQARQGELRLMCTTAVIAREGGPESIYAEACTLALDAGYMNGDGPATFDALAAAYALAAADIAVRDATTDPEPAFYTVASAAESP